MVTKLPKYTYEIEPVTVFRYVIRDEDKDREFVTCGGRYYTTKEAEEQAKIEIEKLNNGQ